MNAYLLAAIGTIIILAAGYLFYSVIYKAALADAPVSHSVSHIVLTIVLIYIAALLFTGLYNNSVFAFTTNGLVKGLVFGIMFGLAGVVLPLTADGAWFKTGKANLRAVLYTWFVGFVVFGAIVGLLAK